MTELLEIARCGITRRTLPVLLVPPEAIVLRCLALGREGSLDRLADSANDVHLESFEPGGGRLGSRNQRPREAHAAPLAEAAVGLVDGPDFSGEADLHWRGQCSATVRRPFLPVPAAMPGAPADWM